MGRRESGGRVRAMTHVPETQDSRQLTELHDYRVEYTLLSEAGALPRWKQQAQYALGRALCDYYSLSPQVRMETPIQFVLERVWPPNSRAFPSLLDYWDVKTKLADELTRFACAEDPADYPVMRYEQWSVPVPQLSIKLSLIVQLGWQAPEEGKGLILQKFMVQGDDEVIKAFIHMANVFCRMAYGVPPERIEVHSLLDGMKHVATGAKLPLENSLDYMRLLAAYMQEEQPEPQPACSAGGAEDTSRSLLC